VVSTAHDLRAPRRTTVLAGCAASVSVACGFATAKAIALHGGARGLGAFAQVLAVVTLIGLLGDIGVGSAIVVAVANASSAARETVVWSVRWFTLATGVAMGLVAVAVGIAAGASGAIVLKAAASGVVTLITAQELAIASSLRLQRSWAIATMGKAVGGSAVAVFLIAGLGWTVPNAVLVSAVTSCLVVLFVVRSVTFAGDRRLSRTALRPLIVAGSRVTAGVACGAGSLAALPIVIAARSDVEGAGSFRAITLVSAGILSVAASLFGSIVYPRLAAMRSGEVTVEAERFGTGVAHNLVHAVTFVCGALAFLPAVLRLATSGAFAHLEMAWRIVLAFEGFRCVQWYYAFALLADGAWQRFALGEACLGGSMLVFTVVGLDRWGLPGASAGVASAVVASCLVERTLARHRWPQQLVRSTDRVALRVLANSLLVLVLAARPTLLPLVLLAWLALWSGCGRAWLRLGWQFLVRRTSSARSPAVPLS
jgi:O-antigen/teichoic acid export membrane protein